MKKIALIISLVAFFALGGNAQSKTFKYGLKLGPTFNWVSAGSTVVGNEGLGIGLGLGVVTDYCYSSHIALSSGLNFNLMRMKYHFMDLRASENFLEESAVSVKRVLSAKSISVPLKFKLRVDVMDSWRAYVEVGADLGLNLADRAKDEFKYDFTDSNGLDYIDVNYEDYRYQYRRFQAALDFGLGAAFEVNSKLSLFAQLTFNHAFVNAFTREMERKTGSIVYNNFIGLEIGFLH